MLTRSESLHTTELGESGSRVVFLHGLFGQGKNWTSVAKELAAEHRVSLVDLPHHGRSPWSDRFDYLDVVDRVAELLTEIGGVDEPVALVGHSMGGKVAMITALRHPGLVERLCVVDIAPVAYQHVSEFAGYVAAMQGIDLSTLERRSDAEEALAEAVPSSAVRGFLLQNLRRHADGWAWQVNLDVLGRDLAELGGWPEDRLAGTPAYDRTVLWVAGADSRYVRPEYAEPMGRWFPRHRRVTVKGAGHWVHSEQPAIFLEVLRRFLV